MNKKEIMKYQNALDGLEFELLNKIMSNDKIIIRYIETLQELIDKLKLEKGVLKMKFKNLKTFNKTIEWLEQNETVNAMKRIIEKGNFDSTDEDYFTHLVHVLLENARNKAVRAGVHRYFYKYFAHQSYDILNRHRWLYLDYYQNQEPESETFYYGYEITFRLKTIKDERIVEYWEKIIN